MAVFRQSSQSRMLRRASQESHAGLKLNAMRLYLIVVVAAILPTVAIAQEIRLIDLSRVDQPVPLRPFGFGRMNCFPFSRLPNRFLLFTIEAKQSGSPHWLCR